MTPDALARLQAAAYTFGRPWNAAEFEALLDDPHVFVVGDARAFALGRVVVDEAELLALATDPNHRRQGLGAERLSGYEAEARARGAATSFLEVAEPNVAAIGLYRKFGYRTVARRENYYENPPLARCAALVMRKALSPAGQGRSPARTARNSC